MQGIATTLEPSGILLSTIRFPAVRDRREPHEPGQAGASVKTMPIRDLGGALAYRNPILVARYAKRKGLSAATAEHHFEELKKFLVVCGVLEEPCCPSEPLDEIWHHFILHTREYADYCERFIGRFLHHNPTERPSLASRPAMLILARNLFGPVDSAIWPSEEIVTCSSNCSHDNYCDDGS